MHGHYFRLDRQCRRNKTIKRRGDSMRRFQISFMVLAALIPVRAQCSHTLVSGGIYCEQSVSPAIVSGTAYALSSVANSSGATAVYTGTVTGGAGNALAGRYIRVSGFSTSANNGGFICAASSGTTLTLDNSSRSSRDSITRSRWRERAIRCGRPRRRLPSQVVIPRAS